MLATVPLCTDVMGRYKVGEWRNCYFLNLALIIIDLRSSRVGWIVPVLLLLRKKIYIEIRKVFLIFFQNSREGRGIGFMKLILKEIEWWSKLSSFITEGVIE